MDTLFLSPPSEVKFYERIGPPGYLQSGRDPAPEPLRDLFCDDVTRVLPTYRETVKGEASGGMAEGACVGSHDVTQSPTDSNVLPRARVTGLRGPYLALDSFSTATSQSYTVRACDKPWKLVQTVVAAGKLPPRSAAASGALDLETSSASG